MKRKKFLHFISMQLVLLNLLVSGGYSQNPVCQWANTGGGVLSESADGVVSDANGNVLVCGAFESDSIVFDNFVLYNSYTVGTDVFVVKYSPSGTVLWAKRGAGNLDEYAKGIAVDRNGNVIVTGYFRGQTMSFDSFGLTNSGLGDPEIFVVKFDSSGNVLWARSAGGMNYDYGRSVSVDKDGNAYVAGYFESPTIQIGTQVLTNGNASGSTPDMFLAKYDAYGTVVWATNTGSSDPDAGFGVTTDTTGNVYVTGYFSGPSVTFGTITISNPLPGGGPMFLVKYDSGGNALWAKCAGGGPSSIGWSAATDPNNNVAVCGSFFDTGNALFGPFTLTSEGGYDMFLAKYDASGNELWAKSAGGLGEEHAYGVASDPAGIFLVCGHFQSDTMNAGTSALVNLSSGFEKDIFLLKYNGNGAVVWAQGIGGADEDYSAAVASDPSGYYFVSGYFMSPSVTSGACSLSAQGGFDMMVMKFSDDVTATPESPSSAGIKIYPNPSRGVLEVQLSLPNEMGDNAPNGILNAAVFNTLGEIVYSDTWYGNTNRVIRLEVPDGIYILKLTGTDGAFVRMFMVAH